MDFKTMKDFSFSNRRVMVRVDFNVPIDDAGNIIDDTRIQAAVPTLKHIIDEGATQLIVMSHLGRPKGENVEKLRLDRVADRLSDLIGMEVAKADDCVGIDLPYGRIVMLENLRFHNEEKSKEDWERQEFAKKLADYADIYVNDAFAVCHRKHASVYDITRYLPACAGLLVERELTAIGDAMVEPKKPFIAIMGGAKLGTKIGAIRGMLKKVDKVLLGGAMIFTFYKAKGLEIGSSLYSEDDIPLAKELMEEGNDKLILPSDVVCASEADADSQSDVFSAEAIPADMKGLDIGPDTINTYKSIIKEASTIVWNGPMGLYEIERFSVGTFEIVREIAASEAMSVCGGGETGEVIDRLGLADKMTHVSTGGGASLELFEGKELVAIKALKDNVQKFR